VRNEHQEQQNVRKQNVRTTEQQKAERQKAGRQRAADDLNSGLSDVPKNKKVRN
jgi:hypothetical protein